MGTETQSHSMGTETHTISLNGYRDTHSLTQWVQRHTQSHEVSDRGVKRSTLFQLEHMKIVYSYTYTSTRLHGMYRYNFTFTSHSLYRMQPSQNAYKRSLACRVLRRNTAVYKSECSKLWLRDRQMHSLQLAWCLNIHGRVNTAYWTHKWKHGNLTYISFLLKERYLSADMYDESNCRTAKIQCFANWNTSESLWFASQTTNIRTLTPPRCISSIFVQLMHRSALSPLCIQMLLLPNNITALLWTSCIAVVSFQT
jgi:hypothetical protein